jgi:tRNA-specific adenosine deaminase 1
MNDSIVRIVIEKYKSLTNQKEETILAGIVNLNTLECVALGTGLKCLPKNKQNSNGFLVNDSHAEIICKRNFIRYLMNQVKSFENGEDSIIIKNEKYELKHKFAFYTSQGPCGDATQVTLKNNLINNDSINTMMDVNNTNNAINSLDSTKAPLDTTYNIKKTKDSIHTGHSNVNGKILKKQKTESSVLKGRMGYEILGKLRTKPGKNNCQPTNSLSCSDKMCKWQNIGFGSFISFFFGMISFEFIVVGDDYNDYIHHSLMMRASIDHMGYKTKIIPIYHTNVKFDYSISSNSHLPKSFNSKSYSFPEKLEIIVNGLKQGAKTQSISTAASISKYKLGLLFKEIVKDSPFNYNELKLLAGNYQKAKTVLYENGLKGWPRNTHLNEFEII